MTLRPNGVQDQWVGNHVLGVSFRRERGEVRGTELFQVREKILREVRVYVVK